MVIPFDKLREAKRGEPLARLTPKHDRLVKENGKTLEWNVLVGELPPKVRKFAALEESGLHSVIAFRFFYWIEPVTTLDCNENLVGTIQDNRSLGSLTIDGVDYTNLAGTPCFTPLIKWLDQEFDRRLIEAEPMLLALMRIA